ncbi:pentapeptide repeat-containing protein [Clostridium sp. 'White wine YQ']|uniref:pentapeptide repeat-containing protein n=1 Tax=Clostridium sp. 'White wine YQ' TaxID=3027474 RepID=UPI002366542A|nr:pentapeptide repeat-containing protein [Clostridium sp. 'White wine YQ']MDD7794243.1 pentapeptide repeat-containing protein [Clostridium sp. 'White wine YQ']
MKNNNENIKIEVMNNENLKADCEKCFGFCCVALYFSASEGFPENKDAGKPCINLQSDFRCKVHKELKKKGLKGCMAYDCFGAGQKVAQVTYEGNDWRKNPESSKEMYECFLIMRQIHEMLWYLTEASSQEVSSELKFEIKSIIDKTEELTLLKPDALLKLDLVMYRVGVNKLLKRVSEQVRKKYYSVKKTPLKGKRIFGGGLDLVGKDLRKKDLRGEDLSGAFLIAANLRGVDLSGADLIGADLRDADISGTNLSKSVFLTQGQINAAKGDSSTRLPKLLTKPSHW